MRRLLALFALLLLATPLRPAPIRTLATRPVFIAQTTIVRDGHLPKPAHLIAPGNALHLPAGVAARAYPDLPGLPERADVSRFDPPVGDQGFLGSCASWATANLVAWYADRQGVRGYPFAPMYVYSQVNGGVDGGSDMASPLRVAAHGIARLADYTQGNYDWQTAPTASEKGAAATYRLINPHQLYPDNNEDVGLAALRPVVERQLASGSPIILSFQVSFDFGAITTTSPYMPPTATIYPTGGHAVLAVAYDQYGLWIENQWGESWGQFGYAELSWDALAASTMQVWAADGLRITGPQPADPAVTAGPPRLYSTATTISSNPDAADTFVLRGAGFRPNELLWATGSDGEQWAEYVRPDGTVDFPGSAQLSPGDAALSIRVWGGQGEAALTYTYTVV